MRVIFPIIPDFPSTRILLPRQNGDANTVDRANGLVVDCKGNVIVTGLADGDQTTSGTNWATIKYNDDGDTKWIKRYNGPGNGRDEATAIATDSKGNIYVTGYSTGIGTGPDFTTIKYDDDGNTKWVKRYNGPGNDFDQAFAIAVDEDGNVYVTGTSTGSGPFGDITTIKYDDDGNTKWVRRYNGPGNSNDEANAIAVDKYGNVYVTGSSEGINTSSDYATIKYEQTPLITTGPATNPDQNNPVVADRGLAKLIAKAFPNAFTDYINLLWSGSDKPVTITITDMLGKLVEKRTGLASSGNIRTGYQFKAGVYFATIVQGTEKLVIKLIKK